MCKRSYMQDITSTPVDISKPQEILSRSILPLAGGIEQGLLSFYLLLHIATASSILSPLQVSKSSCVFLTAAIKYAR